MVTGTFTVPTLQVPGNAQDGITYSAAVWVGIDGGLACPGAVLQTDVIMNTTTAGDVRYNMPLSTSGTPAVRIPVLSFS